MAIFRKFLKNRKGDTIIPVLDQQSTSHYVCWAMRDSINVPGGTGVKIPLTNNNNIYDSQNCSISNGVITLQPGKYLCSVFGRWNDMAGNNNNAFLSFSINDQAGDDPYGIWAFTNNRLTQQVIHVFDLSEPTTLRAYVYSERAASITRVKIDVIKIM